MHTVCTTRTCPIRSDSNWARPSCVSARRPTRLRCWAAQRLGVSLSFTLSMASLALPAASSILPSRRSLSFPVRSPAACFTLPLSLSLFMVNSDSPSRRIAWGRLDGDEHSGIVAIEPVLSTPWTGRRDSFALMYPSGRHDKPRSESLRNVGCEIRWVNPTTTTQVNSTATPKETRTWLKRVTMGR